MAQSQRPITVYAGFRLTDHADPKVVRQPSWHVYVGQETDEASLEDIQDFITSLFTRRIWAMSQGSTRANEDDERALVVTTVSGVLTNYFKGLGKQIVIHPLASTASSAGFPDMFQINCTDLDSKIPWPTSAETKDRGKNDVSARCQWQEVAGHVEDKLSNDERDAMTILGSWGSSVGSGDTTPPSRSAW